MVLISIMFLSSCYQNVGSRMSEATVFVLDCITADPHTEVVPGPIMTLIRV